MEGSGKSWERETLMKKYCMENTLFLKNKNKEEATCSPTISINLSTVLLLYLKITEIVYIVFFVEHACICFPFSFKIKDSPYGISGFLE